MKRKVTKYQAAIKRIAKAMSRKQTEAKKLFNETAVMLRSALERDEPMPSTNVISYMTVKLNK